MPTSWLRPHTRTISELLKREHRLRAEQAVGGPALVEWSGRLNLEQDEVEGEGEDGDDDDSEDQEGKEEELGKKRKRAKTSPASSVTKGLHW